MKHYDGPAFYKRASFLKQRQLNRNNSAITSEYVAPTANSFKTNAEKATESRQSQPKPAPSLPKTPKPAVKPAIIHNSSHVLNYYSDQRSRRVKFYDELVAQLEIAPEDLIVMDPVNSEPQTPAAEITNSQELISAITETKPAIEQSLNHHLVDDEVGTEVADNAMDNSESPQSVVKTTTDVVAEKVTPVVTDLPKSKQIDAKPITITSYQDEQTPEPSEPLKKSVEPRDSVPVTPAILTKQYQPAINKVSSPVIQPKKESVGEGTEVTKEPVMTEPVGDYEFPKVSLLVKPNHDDDEDLDEWIEHQINVLDQTLAAFNIDANVVDWTNGPTVTQFQIKLALGVKVSRITNLSDDLKLALAAKDIRIEAPIPGKTTVGIEIPNPRPKPVVLSEIIDSPAFRESKSPLTTAVGVDLSGNPQVTDISKMPHGLIAGATGSGKSVFINSLLVSLLYKANPSELKLLLIDPKAVELAPYEGIGHLLAPVISDPKSAAAALKWVTEEMDNRYDKMSAAGVRNIEQFNQTAEEHHEYGLKLPYILVIIDELADLMMVSANEVESYIVRITQKARAAGIHLIVATQRPSVDVVTGLIKNNIPSRIAFMVSSQIDSRTILDSAGAEQLLGKGDMLFLGNGINQPIRLQGAFVNNQELEAVVNFVKQKGAPKYLFTPESIKQSEINDSEDELMPEVMDFIAEEETVSTSKIQRVFSIGYNRAANIIDSLEAHHYISKSRGSKPREVYYQPESSETDDEQ